MKKNIFKIVPVTVMILSFWGNLYAQTCTVMGHLKEGTLGNPIYNANVSILGTEIGTFPTSDGLYVVNNAPIGEITVILSQTGVTLSTRTIYTQTGNTYWINFWLAAVIDVDGNRYSAVEIGTQVWMGENLKVTHLKDEGTTEIPNVMSPTEWSTLTLRLIALIIMMPIILVPMVCYIIITQ